jgi:hypothetical protein
VGDWLLELGGALSRVEHRLHRACRGLEDGRRLTLIAVNAELRPWLQQALALATLVKRTVGDDWRARVLHDHFQRQQEQYHHSHHHHQSFSSSSSSSSTSSSSSSSSSLSPHGCQVGEGHELPESLSVWTGHFLTSLYQMADVEGDGGGFGCGSLLVRMFSRALAPYRAMLDAWVTTGQEEDPRGEFCISHGLLLPQVKHPPPPPHIHPKLPGMKRQLHSGPCSPDGAPTLWIPLRMKESTRVLSV